MAYACHRENMNSSENFQDREPATSHDQLARPELQMDSSSACQTEVDLRIPQNETPSHEQVLLETMGPNVQVESNVSRASDLLMAVTSSAEVNRMRISELASEAMEELNKLAIAQEPLWQCDVESNTEFLNDIEYMREFGHISASLVEIIRMVEVPVGDSQPNIHDSEFYVESEQKPTNHQPGKTVFSESSRAIDYVKMQAVNLVQLLMDPKQWQPSFPNIVSRAKVVGVLSSTGFQGNHDGTLQVMTAEFHARTPLIPARECYFARYSKQLDREMWAVVDVSLEKLFQFPSTNYRRQPSGCLIQDVPNGCSKVMWVEHVEVDNRMVHNMFKPLVTSGFAFSAKRWLSTLVRQCEWLETLNSSSHPTSDFVLISQAGRRSLLKLSERMMRSFVADISASTENKWRALPLFGAEDVKVTTKTSLNNDPGRPPGMTLLFATSVHLPVPRTKIHNLLRDGESRFMWDMLSYEKDTREMAYIATGHHPGNRVSIIQVQNGEMKETEILYLQESYTDSTGSYIVYAPMDRFAMSALLEGADPDQFAILASGFSILPDRPMANDECGGSLLTVALQITQGGVTEEYIPPQTVQNILKIISGTVIQITDVLSNDSPNNS